MYDSQTTPIIHVGVRLWEFRPVWLIDDSKTVTYLTCFRRCVHDRFSRFSEHPLVRNLYQDSGPTACFRVRFSVNSLSFWNVHLYFPIMTFWVSTGMCEFDRYATTGWRSHTIPIFSGGQQAVVISELFNIDTCHHDWAIIQRALSVAQTQFNDHGMLSLGTNRSEAWFVYFRGSQKRV